MKVFCDLHHHDLYYSLQLLFEKRLGAEMYRPIGMEWYEQGFWAVYPHPDTARQFLGLDHAIDPPKDVHGNYLSDREQLNKYYRFEDGIYYVRDTTKEKVQRGITLDKFKDTSFDILISSIPQHIPLFNRLIQKFQPDAKHIFQVGNAWGRRPGVYNILSSTAPFSTPADINVAFYHQEFDLDIFQYEHPVVHNEVDSYIHYMKETNLLEQYKANLPGWKFRTHGAGMQDCFHKTADIAQQMMDSAWTWHVKPGGDGYGHVLHNTFACGRPVITKTGHYSNRLGGQLLEDQVTCIDIGRRTQHENVRALQLLSQPDAHIEMCARVYKRFCDLVNFDEEEQKIRKFLENLR